jgi:hypothetical protein
MGPFPRIHINRTMNSLQVTPFHRLRAHMHLRHPCHLVQDGTRSILVLPPNRYQKSRRTLRPKLLATGFDRGPTLK